MDQASVDGSPSHPDSGLPRSQDWTLRHGLGSGYRSTHLRFVVPDWRSGKSGNLSRPLGWYSTLTSLGSPSQDSVDTPFQPGWRIPAMQVITGNEVPLPRVEIHFVWSCHAMSYPST